MLWRLPRGFLDAESCQIDISPSVDHQQQRIMRQIVQRIHGGTDGGDITTVLRHAAHHAPDGVAGIGIGDADMPIKIPDRTVKIGDRPLVSEIHAAQRRHALGRRLDLFSYNGRGNREIYAQQDDGGQDNRHDEQYRFADTTPYAMPSMTSALP